MTPIKFPEVNVTYAENQPQYLPLPALRLDDEHGTVVSCWKMGFWERFRVLFTGKIWLTLSAFGRPLTPSRLSTECPFITVRPGRARRNLREGELVTDADVDFTEEK